MYRGLPKQYKKQFDEFFRKRNHWLGLVIYDFSFMAFALRYERESGKFLISAIKRDRAEGIRAGRITHSYRAGEVIENLLRSLSEEAQIKDKRILIGLDAPSLMVTPNNYSDNSCFKVPCNETNYKRILYSIYREYTNNSAYLLEIIPLRIFMDKRLVENPCGITGQMQMENMLISLSNQDLKDFEVCLDKTGYRVESYFSGFYNLCSAYSSQAVENECVLFLDIKFNSTDVILFQGDQPVTINSFPMGLDLVAQNITSLLNIDRKESIFCLAKYFQKTESDDEMAKKNDQTSRLTELQYWEIREMINEYLKQCVFMENGIADMIAEIHRSYQIAPSKVMITGVGARLPRIEEFFLKTLNIKTIKQHWHLPGAKTLSVPATLFGMARSIFIDAGAPVKPS